MADADTASVEMFNYHMKKSPFQTYSYEISDVDREGQDLISIFWTGGWDSTFRVLQLARKDIIVQPIYLDDRRKSTERELHAINTIGAELKKQKSTKFRLEDVLILSTRSVNENESITAAYKRLRGKKFMGSQYDWLARFAEGSQGIELCIHKDDKALEVIESFGKVRAVQAESVGLFYIIDSANSQSDLVKLFGNFHFPLLNMTKVEMKEEAERLGQMQLMHLTWFCFNPLDDKPCGSCNPCIYSIEEGMSWRFSAAALRRYRMRHILRALGNLMRALGKTRRAAILVLRRLGIHRD